MEIPVPLGLGIIGVVLFLVGLYYRRKIQRINEMPPIPADIPTSGFEVPLLAAFTGARHLPRQISFSHNNASPSLTLFEDRIECRVIARRSIALKDIERIDIWDTFATRNLNVHVRGREDTFTANLLSRRNLAEVLQYLERRGVPLEQDAAEFLRTTGR